MARAAARAAATRGSGAAPAKVLRKNQICSVSAATSGDCVAALRSADSRLYGKACAGSNLCALVKTFQTTSAALCCLFLPKIATSIALANDWRDLAVGVATSVP